MLYQSEAPTRTPTPTYTTHPPIYQTPNRFDDLCNRFEPPSAANRWDRPLIRCRMGSSSSSSSSTEEAAAAVVGAAAAEGAGAGAEVDLEGVYRQVLAALVEGRPPTAGMSTAVVRGGGCCYWL